MNDPPFVCMNVCMYVSYHLQEECKNACIYHTTVSLPRWLRRYLDVFLKLCFTVLLPSLLGLALRSAVASAAAWAKKHKTALSLFSTTNLVCLIWQSLSAAAAALLQQSPANIATVVAAAAMLHGNHYHIANMSSVSSFL